MALLTISQNEKAQLLNAVRGEGFISTKHEYFFIFVARFQNDMFF